MGIDAQTHLTSVSHPSQTTTSIIHACNSHSAVEQARTLEIEKAQGIGTTPLSLGSPSSLGVSDPSMALQEVYNITFCATHAYPTKYTEHPLPAHHQPSEHSIVCTSGGLYPPCHRTPATPCYILLLIIDLDTSRLPHGSPPPQPPYLSHSSSVGGTSVPCTGLTLLTSCHTSEGLLVGLCYGTGIR